MADGGLVPAPPGWFADPIGLSDLRWWSGVDWTEHVSASPTVQPADVPRPGTLLASAAPAVPKPGTFVPPQPTTSAYVPFGGNEWATNPGAADPRSWLPTAPARWNTAGAWALGASPLVGVLTAVGLVFATRSWWWSLTTALLPLLWSVAAASRDRKRLDVFGYGRLPSLWWLLLGPLAYLIVRTVRIRAQSGHGSAPLWWHLGILVILTGVSVAAWSLLATLLRMG
ncbi:MAG: DUF2510 domain-containing protein [Actinomycetota bacterium]